MTENDVPNYDLMGALANATTWCAVWFDLDPNGYADQGTLIVEPVACWASYAIRQGKKKQVVVGGLVAGPSGLYLAEQEDENFRGYVPFNNEEAVAMFVANFNKAVMDEGADDEGDEEEVEETEGEEVD